MANEIAIVVSMSFSKGGAIAQRAESISVDVTGDTFSHEVQLVTFGSEVELAQGTLLGTPGYLFLKNLDATNFVKIGATTGVYTIKIKPGEVALYRHESATIYARADTGDCNVEYWLIED